MSTFVLEFYFDVKIKAKICKRWAFKYYQCRFFNIVVIMHIASNLASIAKCKWLKKYVWLSRSTVQLIL